MADDQPKFTTSHHASQFSVSSASFCCESYWTVKKIEYLRDSVVALKELLKEEEWYVFFPFYQNEKKQFLDQLQKSIAAYDAFVPILDRILNSITSHEVSSLVKQHSILGYLKQLTLTISRLENIDSKWRELFFTLCKSQGLENVTNLIDQPALNNDFLLCSIKKLKAHLFAALIVHIDNQFYQ